MSAEALQRWLIRVVDHAKRLGDRIQDQTVISNRLLLGSGCRMSIGRGCK